MDGLEIQQVDGAHGACILILKGSLTIKSLFEFQDLVRREQSNNLIVDLGEVPYMDSAGLGAILGAYASCERNGRPFGLARVCQRVRTLFQVAGVDKLVPQYETVDAAERQLAAKAASQPR
ncbi:MAG TPA: STAS domain-containing protein [Bryobacteraceae bacterium]|nr:STAS domain-containing protein [Bryobacteraceae bacterium]